MKNSPYLSQGNRLADVIAAIQVMGTYRFYKLDFESWADRIAADKTKASHWKRVFEEHPEFFRLDTAKQKASLVWRRQYPKLYHVDKNIEISKEETTLLSAEERLRISRNKLSSEDIKTLIDTATELHARAIEQGQDNRWWVSLLIGLLGSLIGASLGLVSKCSE